MSKPNLTSEFCSLLADVKEHVLYLKELGIESIDVEISDVDLEMGANPPSGKETIPHERLEKLIRSNDSRIGIGESKTLPGGGKTSRRRDGILESTKLVPTSSGMIKDSSQSSVQNSKPTSSVREKPVKEAEEQQYSIFGDISKKLPASSETLEQIHAEIGKDCVLCQLCEKRTQVVNSVGDPNADLMFVGEAPGADEDEQGEPFVGRAGKLLTKIIEAINLTREEVFIGNINRCRPPGNRQPQASEAEVCRPFLLREISVVRPKVIVVMGNTACQNLLDTKVGITKLRGRFQDYFGVKVMPTFHPAYLLRDPRKKREVWEDMKTVRRYLSDN